MSDTPTRTPPEGVTNRREPNPWFVESWMGRAGPYPPRQAEQGPDRNRAPVARAARHG